MTRCSTCSAPLVWITRRGQPALTCPKPACPGDRAARETPEVLHPDRDHSEESK